MVKRAVFLDRDGTIIKMFKNPVTGLMELPKVPEQVEFCDGAVEGMRRLQDAGYALFVISNQPDVAKGKQTPKQAIAIHHRFSRLLYDLEINILRFYYCYHHPDGIHPYLSVKCSCRKPAPGFIIEADEQFDLDLKKSWIVGDMITDVQCGKNAGINAILINNELQFKQACDIILESQYG